MSEERPRVVVLGGGFAGAYTAKYLERRMGRPAAFDVAVVNRNNYFVFQPMLSEVVSGSVDLTDTVVALRRMLPRSDLYVREIQEIDLPGRRVVLRGELFHRPSELRYDHLVFALGVATDFREMPGLPEHALPFKDLADAINLRNHLIRVLEEADTEGDPARLRQLLTFVVAGGGFSGVEVVAVMSEFVRRIARNFHDIDPRAIRVVLVHSGDRLLEREFGEGLSRYAERILREDGVEIVLNRRLAAATGNHAVLDDGDHIPTRTLVSTVPSSPSRILERLDLPNTKGKIRVDSGFQVEGSDHLWALGDCALVPSPTGEGVTPPTAQHAVREARVAAHNIAAALRGGPRKHFTFTGLGKLGLVGHRKGVAELFGRVRLSGFLAYLMWRSVYWWKLPGLDRKINVGVSWALDLVLPPDMVELELSPPRMLERIHFEPGDTVFEAGDPAGCLYLIIEGRAEVVQRQDGREMSLAQLGPGEFFGVSALVDGGIHTETIRCVEGMDVLCLRRQAFAGLLAHLPNMAARIQEAVARRTAQGQPASGQAEKREPPP